MFRICQYKDVIQFLLNGSDAPRVFAFDYVFYLMRKVKVPFFHNYLILYNIYCNIVVYKA